MYNAIAQRLHLNSAARRIYTLDGALVPDIAKLENGGTYVVCCGYETFQPAKYLDPVDPAFAMEAAAPSAGPSRARSTRNRRSARTAKPKAKKPVAEQQKPSFFTPFTKAYRVVVFANGDYTHKGATIYLNSRNCRTWDQFLNEVSHAIPKYAISIRRVYNALSGQLIEKWTDLFDGINVVAAGTEPFLPRQYKVVSRDELDGKHRVQQNPHSEKPIVITLYPNGDSYHMGFNVSVTQSRFPTLDKVSVLTIPPSLIAE